MDKNYYMLTVRTPYINDLIDKILISYEKTEPWDKETFQLLNVKVVKSIGNILIFDDEYYTSFRLNLKSRPDWYKVKIKKEDLENSPFKDIHDEESALLLYEVLDE